MRDSHGAINLAVVGATGEVGRELLAILEQRRFPMGNLKLLASERSAGQQLTVAGKAAAVAVLDASQFKGCRLALFAAGAEVSRTFAPQAVSAGCVVVDKSSAFRADPEIPLVVPEVNSDDLAGMKTKGIISSPNCSTIPLVLVLKPIDVAAGVKRVVISTYQSVSGAGRKGVEELERQLQDRQAGRTPVCRTFSKPIALNCLPHIDRFDPDGYTKEERKTIDESRRILHRPDLRLTATTVRVPVVRGHSLAVNVELERRLSADEARQLLRGAPGVLVMDQPGQNLYPTALDAAGGDLALVGRIREDTSVPFGLDFWVVADNIRKGAALNAIQIAETLVERYL